MRLNVPFYENNGNDCGSVALRMVLSYFGKTIDVGNLKNLSMSDTKGATLTIGLAKASAELGFKTEFYSKYLGFNPENFKLEYYQKETDGENVQKKKLQELHNACLKNGGVIKERTMVLEEILSRINKNCLAIVLVDWNVLKGKKGYQGHFLPIVGYDERNVYVHHSGPTEPKSYLAF